MVGTLHIAHVCAVAALLIGMAVMNPALADDPLANLTPLGSADLGSANVHHNLFNTNGISNSATQQGNTVTANGHGQIVNGAIQSNNIANNSGVTAVMMNTGNNVNFNNAMIVNVIVH